ncbi:MAG: SPOR domain-containing protein [Flavobacteriales bacterium]
MRIEAFVSDLLFEHDCVVVPGFGGLVANYRAARLHTSTHRISPPAKHIGFNKNLFSNDGLLAHHVAGITGWAYSKAVSAIEEAVKDCNKQLKTEGRLVWEKIGVFYTDHSGQVQFLPDDEENYLLESYGMQTVQLKYIGGQIQDKQTPIIPISKRSHSARVWSIAAAASIPILLGAGLLLRNQVSHLGATNLSSLNPFGGHQIVAGYEPHHQVELAEVIPIEDSESVSTSPTITAENATVNAWPIADVKADESAQKAAAPANLQKGKHAVIGGAFRVSANADRYLKKLRAEGFDAQFAGKKDGMTLVAYGIYDNATEADTALQNLLQASDVRAWIKHF